MLEFGEKFEIPKNVKQIGGVDNFLKIYMEDYVYNYLKQYSKSEGPKNKYCALVGKVHKNQLEKVIMIKGVIRCNIKSSFDDTSVMPDRIKLFMEEEQKNYYPDLEMVGWMHATDEDIKRVIEYDKLFHRINFNGSNKILFLTNYEDDIEEMYFFRDNMLAKLQGFYVYYEKNKEMQTYSSENKIEVELLTKKVADYKSKTIITTKPNNTKNERNPNASRMMASLGFAMLIMCVIMGFGMIKSLEKINDVESKVTFLNEGYVMLQEKVNNQDSIPVTANLADEEKQIANGNEEIISVVKEKYTKYIVKEGDNLNKISFLHYNTIDKSEKIMEANKLSSVNKIYVGQELIIPMD
ncbi:MAG TPA: hypothetical protein DEP72_02980 [Clostridiales bacterium]|nr:MAG: hypothetical protein A2Y18_04670 [Clostridiales bacterium GWD2_32_19]HCC07118.1 hypothetical protein [Clostridiales bacterium]